MRVWCAQKGATRLVSTMNKSREWECCECDYVQTRCVNESCVWDVNGKEVMICGQRPAGFVCACAGAHEQPANNWQSRVLGGGSGSLPQSSTLVWFPRAMSVLITIAQQLELSQIPTGIGQSGTNWPSRNRSDKMAKLGEMMDFHFDFWVRNKAPVHLILSQNAFFWCDKESIQPQLRKLAVLFSSKTSKWKTHMQAI